MQLNYKLSLVCASVLCSSLLQAQDYVHLNVMNYDESNNRVSVLAPAIEINKDFGVDYTAKISYVRDAVSGATPIYTDASSGASAFKRGTVANIDDIQKQNVNFTETRALASASLITRLKNRDEITTSFSNSYESDYDSNTFSANYLHWANKSKNLSFNLGLAYTSSTILVHLGDDELSEDNSRSFQRDDDDDDDDDGESGASKKETATTVASQAGFTQIIDKSSLYKFDVFYSSENGYLTNPYYNVVRNQNELVGESRPDARTSYGFNVKYIKAFKNNITSKFKYKYYTDDWGINSHTIDVNNYYSINKKLTLGFGARYYTQSEADFYSSDITHFTNEKYASHDDRISSFNAQTYKLSLDYKLSKKVSFDFSYSMYTQDTSLDAQILTSGIKYKF